MSTTSISSVILSQGLLITILTSLICHSQSKELLSVTPYHDPSGFFSIIPPAGWKIQEYPDDPRGKVKFIAPDVRGVSLLVIAMATDMSSINKVVTSTEESEKKLLSKYQRYNPSGGHEIIEWYGLPAVKGYFSIPNNFRQESLEFLVGKQYYNPSYAAPSSLFTRFKDQAMLSMRTLEPVLKDLSTNDAKKHLIASKIRLANLNIQLGYKASALRAINEGLELDPNNKELLSLKNSLHK